jgi:hypothetical protein
MPLSPVSFLERGGNQLLQGLLSGSQVSLTKALSDAVQLTRDSNSNQLSQENSFLKERQFDSTFREGVRQFDITDDDRDAARELTGELGRGNLDVARGGLDLKRRDLQIEIDKEEALDSIRERERIASDPSAWEAHYRIMSPESNAVQVARAREQELDSISKDYARYDADNNALLAIQGKAAVGLLPGSTPRDDVARDTAELGIDFINKGNFVEGAAHLARALAEATPGSGQHAYIDSALKSLAAKQAARNVGSSISMEAATESLDIYTKHGSASFGDSKSFSEEVVEVLASETKKDYINKEPEARSAGRGPTATELDTRRKNRAAFYDAVTASSRKDRWNAEREGDPFASQLRGLIPTLPE